MFYLHICLSILVWHDYPLYFLLFWNCYLHSDLFELIDKVEFQVQIDFSKKLVQFFLMILMIKSELFFNLNLCRYPWFFVIKILKYFYWKNSRFLISLSQAHFVFTNWIKLAKTNHLSMIFMKKNKKSILQTFKQYSLPINLFYVQRVKYFANF